MLTHKMQQVAVIRTEIHELGMWEYSCWAKLFNFPSIFFNPWCRDGCRPPSPHIDHQRWWKILHSVDPPPWQIEDFPFIKCKGQGMGLGIQWKLLSVRRCFTLKCLTPFQHTLVGDKVQVIKVCWWVDSPLLLANDLVCKVVFAVKMPLCESALAANPACKAEGQACTN